MKKLTSISILFSLTLQTAFAAPTSQTLDEETLKQVCAPEIEKFEKQKNNSIAEIQAKAAWVRGYLKQRKKIKAMYEAYYERVVKGAVQPVIEEAKKDKRLNTLRTMQLRANGALVDNEQLHDAFRPYFEKIASNLSVCSTLSNENEKIHASQPKELGPAKGPSCVRTIEGTDHYIERLDEVTYPSTGIGLTVTTGFELGRVGKEREYENPDDSSKYKELEVSNCDALGIKDPSELSRARCIAYKGIERRIDLSADFKIPSKADFVKANMQALDQRQKDLASSVAWDEKDLMNRAAPECRRFMKGADLKRYAKIEEESVSKQVGDKGTGLEGAAKEKGEAGKLTR